MNLHQPALLLVCCLHLCACQSANLPISVAARLQAPTKEVRQQVNEMTAKMLGLHSVTLDEKTLVNSSQFMVARTPRYDASGQLLQGRVIEQGHLFKLVLRDGQCWLIYHNKNQEALLSLATCVAE
jgi:hypothetical protein